MNTPDNEKILNSFERALQGHYVGEFVTLIKIDLSFQNTAVNGQNVIYISNNQETLTANSIEYVYCPCELSIGSSTLSANSSATLRISNVGDQMSSFYAGGSGTVANTFSGGMVHSIRTLKSELTGLSDATQYEAGVWKIMRVLSFSRTALVLSLGSELSSSNAVVPAVKMTRAKYGALV